MKTKKLIFKLLLLSLVFVSCSKNETLTTDSLTRYEDGIIVSSEGNFNSKDGSISYVSNDFSSASNFIYKASNGAQLGGLVQSVTFNNDKAYIVLNDVNTLVIADKFSFIKKRIITEGLNNTRYMAVIGNKGYITNWGTNVATDDYIAVVDLVLNKYIGKIAVENGPEQILAKDGKLYVSHKGAFSSNNIVSVIEPSLNNKVSTITVKDNPDDMFFNTAGELVVLSEGKPLAYGGAPDYPVLTNTQSAISFINVATKSVDREINFAKDQSATFLVHSDNKMYYYKQADAKVYAIDDSATTLATEGVDVGSVYGMNVRDGKLYIVKYSFLSLSELSIIDFLTAKKIYSTAVGLGASKIYFVD